MHTGEFWALIRFRADAEEPFRRAADEVVAYWRSCPGCVGAVLVKSLDDPVTWSIVANFSDVGSYRRSFSGYEAKLLLTPLLSQAIDEPTAYLPPESH